MNRTAKKFLCLFIALPMLLTFVYLPVSAGIGFGITAYAEEDEEAPGENEDPPEEDTPPGGEDEPDEPGEEDPTEAEDEPSDEPVTDITDSGSGEEDETLPPTSDGEDETEETTQAPDEEDTPAAGGVSAAKTKVRKKTSEKTKASDEKTTEETSVSSSVLAAVTSELKEPEEKVTASVSAAAVSAVVILTAAAGAVFAAVWVRRANGIKLEYDPGTEADEFNCPYGALEFNSKYGKYNASALTDYEDRIILTFDPDYETGHAEQILDILKEKKVSALFFLTGKCVKKQSSLIGRMIKEGHMLGNCGMTGASMVDMTASALKEDITSLHEHVLQKYGYGMQYLRPPYGEFSKKTLSAAKNLGYETLMWSFAYTDRRTDDVPDKTAALEEIVSAAHSGGIYLFCFAPGTDASVLGDAIDILRNDGFVF